MGSATGESLVGGIGLREGVGGIVADEGLDAAVQPVDLIQAGLGELRGQLASRLAKAGG